MMDNAIPNNKKIDMIYAISQDNNNGNAYIIDCIPHRHRTKNSTLRLVSPSYYYIYFDNFDVYPEKYYVFHQNTAPFVYTVVNRTQTQISTENLKRSNFKIVFDFSFLLDFKFNSIVSMELDIACDYMDRIEFLNVACLKRLKELTFTGAIPPCSLTDKHLSILNSIYTMRIGDDTRSIYCSPALKSIDVCKLTNLKFISLRFDRIPICILDEIVINALNNVVYIKLEANVGDAILPLFLNKIDVVNELIIRCDTWNEKIDKCPHLVDAIKTYINSGKIISLLIKKNE